MTTQLYTSWKKALMDAAADSSINNVTATAPYCLLINTTVATAYTGPPAPASQTFATSVYNTIPPTGIVGPSGGVIILTAVTTVGTTDGIFSGGNLTYTSVSGSLVSALCIYRLNPGANSTWRLMSFYDTPGGGLPVSPNGGNITVSWNAGGIFQLSDAEMKHEISQIGTFGHLGLYRYRYRVPNSPSFIGFIAQEVEKVAPWAVRRLGRYKHVNYGALYAEGYNF
jgi:hypothetical protein